jgi:hypothetical protein
VIEERSHNGMGWALFSEASSGAFSTREHRYRLARALTPAAVGYPRRSALDDGLVRIVFVMLNPSTADAFKVDPTVLRCVKFAQSWGGDVLEVVNLFAFRSPYPADLYHVADRGDGPANDAQIVAACTGAVKVIAAWGAHPITQLGFTPRHDQVRRLLARAGVQLHHLGLTADGAPKHPLARGKHRIPDSAVPIPWIVPFDQEPKEQGNG